MPKWLQQANCGENCEHRKKTEMTWPEGTKEPKKCAVEKQTPEVNKTIASHNDPIKLKISQSKLYLTKQHKGSKQ